MDFTLVAKTEGTRAVREGTYTDELKAEVAEAWEYAQKHGETHNIGASFPDKETRDGWLRKAQAYGKTQGLHLSKARGYETADTELLFTVQNLAAREAKIRERKEREKKIAALKAVGVQVSRGVSGVDVDAEFAKLGVEL
jgi:hypothetical protein